MSENLMNQTQGLTAQVEDLAHETMAAEIKVLNTFNSFLNLAYYQYVENVRVAPCLPETLDFSSKFSIPCVIFCL